ncbi:VOC family protein [Streptomyces sp. NPDC004788]
MAVNAQLSSIVIDCADPRALAEFYAKVTGWEINSADDSWASVGQGAVQLAFQRVDGYQGPAWPDAAKHAHLDFKVADREIAVKELLAEGATKPDFQPGGDGWTVLADPEGHLFCVMAA